MTKIKGGIKSSRASMPKKDYIILGNNVYKRTDKLPEDVMGDLLDEDEEVAPPAPEETAPVEFTHDLLRRIVEGVQELFWAQSSYTTIFCTLRDVYAYSISMRGFERIIQTLHATRHFDYACPNNTLATTIRNNGFMRYNTERWERYQVKPKYMKLKQAVINVVNSER